MQTDVVDYDSPSTKAYDPTALHVLKWCMFITYYTNNKRCKDS